MDGEPEEKREMFCQRSVVGSGLRDLHVSPHGFVFVPCRVVSRLFSFLRFASARLLPSALVLLHRLLHHSSHYRSSLHDNGAAHNHVDLSPLCRADHLSDSIYHSRDMHVHDLFHCML